MVSGKVLLGAGVVVVLAVAAYFLLVPSEKAELEKLNAILAKYGVDFPDNFSYAALAALPASTRSTMKSELQDFAAGGAIFKKPESVVKSANFMVAFIDVVNSAELTDKKNAEILAGFSKPPCDSLGTISERNELEAMTISLLAQLQDEARELSSDKDVTLSQQLIDQLTADHEQHVRAFNDLKGGCVQ
ncbi:MAG: hypothetical protein V1676_01150 [Candidatus Diapherotrites archaeon]